MPIAEQGSRLQRMSLLTFPACLGELSYFKWVAASWSPRRAFLASSADRRRFSSRRTSMRHTPHSRNLLLKCSLASPRFLLRAPGRMARSLRLTALGRPVQYQLNQVAGGGGAGPFALGMYPYWYLLLQFDWDQMSPGCFVCVCCSAFAGSLVAIMGPSGCGKTTLLSIISGRSSMPYSGRVFLNGRPLEKDFDRLSSYVSQEDVFEGNETVEECLRFPYRLRKATPRDWDSRERQKYEQETIERALNLLGLASVQHSRVGNGVRRGLSGGQKRRLTIGIGLMSDAKILLCDEPTSGLSAADAQLMVSALRRLSVECGVAVVAVIHQPSHAILQCFDHLLLMAYDGRCVYNSRVDTALQYFSALGFPCPVHQNPADFYLDLVSQSGEHAQDLADVYDQLMRPLVEARVRQALECPPPQLKTQAEAMQVAGAFMQCKEVACRSLRLWLRDHETLWAIGIDSLVQGLVIGGLFYNVRNRASVYYQLSALFLLVLSHLAASLWTIPLYVQQKAQYRAEVVDGYYAPIPFIFATCLVSNMFILLGNFLLATTMWILFGFGFVPLVICLLVSAVGFVVCDVMGVICSLASETFAEANAAATLLFFLLMFVNGFTSNPASLASGIGWISYLSPFFLVFEALAICILEPYNFATSPTETDGHLPLRTKEDVYRTFGLAGRTYGYTGSAITWVWSVDVVLLLVLMVLSKCLSFALQATVFLPKRYKSEAVPPKRFRFFSPGRCISKRLRT
ncbi:hypothetical protein ACSSS7_001733 [Eimeria intestinalis]